MAEEKNVAVMAESIEKHENSTKIEDTSAVNVVKKVHADGHVDLVDAHAIGGNLEDMPAGYFWTPQFIGTVIVRFPAAEYFRYRPLLHLQ
jgi:hypothetical protein